MKPTRFLIVVIAILALVTPTLAQETSNPDICRYSSGRIPVGSSGITFFKVTSTNPGPIVLVTGGIHGNEPAGFRAALQIRNWRIGKGTLVVIPEINRLGLAANTRWLPKHRNNKKIRDLNRNFPTKERMTPRTEIAKAVWKFTDNLKPDYAIDLHEGFAVHKVNPKSVGSSVITYRSNRALGEKLVRAVNQEVPKPKHFSLLAGSGPVKGSLASACHQQLGSKSFIFETTSTKQDLSVRVRQHRILVSTLFQEIGVQNAQSKDLTHKFTGQFNKGQTKVAVFDGPGAGAGKVVKAIENFNPRKVKQRHQRPFFATTLCVKDMTQATLKQFDTVIFPGGSAGRQGKALGPEKRRHVKQFVRNGGGYVGICAGAYLASSHYKWSFGFFNASCFNKMVDIPGKGKKSMWYRGGPADVQVSFNKKTSIIGKTKSEETVRYQNGPILSAGKRPDLPRFQVLARFKTENGIYKAQKDTMIGAPAIVTSKFGKGKVLAISPHFESTNGSEAVLARLLSLVSSEKNPQLTESSN